jgi:signal transduction histidine kinase
VALDGGATMRGVSRRIRAIVVGLAGLVVIGVGYAVPFIGPISPAPVVTPITQAMAAASNVVWLAALLLIMWRQPGNGLWMLLGASILASYTWELGFIPSSLAWTLGELLRDIGQAVLVHIVVAFPTGQLRHGWDRVLVIGVYAYVLTVSLSGLLVWDPDFVCDPGAFCPDSLLLVWPNEQAADVVRWFIAATVPIVAVATLATLGSHWRHATPLARRALLPVLVAFPVNVVISTLYYVSVNLNQEEFAGGVLAAILNPIVGWVSFVIPIGIFLGVLQLHLARIAVSDLVTELVRGVPLGGLRDRLARALHDRTLVLAFPAPSGDGFVDAAGRAVNMPEADASRSVTTLERGDELLAVLIHDPAVEAQLLDAVGGAAQLALANERLTAQVRAQLDEVRASRTRIVEAADAERRRVERDLHDGAQQRLVALAMRLQLARGESDGGDRLIDEATAELQAAIGEVRTLAHGLYPPILTESGLAAAIESLAERTPLPVHIDVAAGRYAPQVEAATYFVVAESLTNMARHARARSGRVEVTERDGRLIVTVTDDGVGGADLDAGSGLRGLVDRVGAVGGTLSVMGRAGGGTAVTAELPVA